MKPLEYQNICMGCMGDKGQADSCPHCGYIEGTPPKNGQYLPPRTMVAGKYLLGRGLGHGGFGITYLAYDTVLKRKLAIKEYLPQDCATRPAGQSLVTPFSAEDKVEQFTYGVDKFLEEARTLAQFDGHPNIVGVRDFFKENGTAYLVMNFLLGETLKEYLRRHERALGYQQALKIMLPVMDALRTVHAAGVLHRDVSPDNIFLTNGGQVKLIDFGAARQPRGGQRSISVILKPGYAPEEQYRSRGKQGPWTDVYATAATFYRAITGKVPPESLDRMEQDTLTAPSKLGVRIPPEAEKALLRAMAVRATDRFQSIQEFKDALNAAEGGGAAAGAQGQRQAEPRIDLPVEPSQRVQQRPPQQPRPPQPRQQGHRPPQRQEGYEDPATYPLRYRRKGGLKVGIIVALLIILIVVAGVLGLLYWLGDLADGGRETPATQLPSAVVTTPAQAEQTPNMGGTITEVPTQTPEETPSPSPTPSPTPLAANMQPGAKPSLPSERYVPPPKQIIIWHEGNLESSRLTGSLGEGLVCERDLNEYDIPTGDTYVYYVDIQGNVRWAKLGEQASGVIYLPADCSVGTVWTSGQGRPQEVVAVDFDATLGGTLYKNCIVVKDGDMYRFYVPGTGLHTIRSSLNEDQGATYRVTEQKGTNIELADYEGAVG